MINLDPFTRVHPYETQEFIINDILKHFQEVSDFGVGKAEVLLVDELSSEGWGDSWLWKYHDNVDTVL